MPNGVYRIDYLTNPDIQEPLETVWSELQKYTNEILEDEPHQYSRIDFWVVLPPLWYEGRFVKGVFFSQAVDFLLKLFPYLTELFIPVAHSMSWSFPWTRQSQADMISYDYPERAAWFRKTHPGKKKKPFIPLQDGDFTHEYIYAPQPVGSKEIDVLIVSRLQRFKNLPIMAKALKIYREKYHRPLRTVWVIGKPLRENLGNLYPSEVEEFKKVEKILNLPSDLVEIRPFVDPFEMPKLYSQSKTYVLASLMEGKNRSLYEAQCCDTPVVCFRQFNQYIRGKAPIFPEGAGVTVNDFDPEALADGIHFTLKNHGDFKPRAAYLKSHGKKFAFHRFIDALAPFYEKKIPAFKKGPLYKNLWLDLAVQANYQLSLWDLIYQNLSFLGRTQGLDNIRSAVDFYFTRARLFNPGNPKYFIY